ncbi:MAG: NAD-dependent epimerase/dehydratase family protein [Nitrospinaceae bacterium]|nr:NAD-dependent epimerase/dehydratase family protein [Nitrospinaceae bacterium]
METVIITGSSGLIGSEAVQFFADKGMRVIGIDNDMRKEFFGDEASTEWNRKLLEEKFQNFRHYSLDIRSEKEMESVFSEYGKDINLVVHTAAQPSHDWAAKDPIKDFSVNANGTLVLLEMTRKFCPDSVFIHLSTNKVYGDVANSLPLQELKTRWELDSSHRFYEKGIDESMSIDGSNHSLFGVSKAAGDLLVQEYGRYFGLKTACFRGGCLTGSGHSGTELHGFLSYLMICTVQKKPYTVFGYKGKQVRDNIHSSDLVGALYHFYKKPKAGQVYNIGGGRYSNSSMLEAIKMCEEISGNKLSWKYEDANRFGDHIWWVSDVSKFQSDYPDWTYQYNMERIMTEIHEGLCQRLKNGS